MHLKRGSQIHIHTWLILWNAANTHACLIAAINDYVNAAHTFQGNCVFMLTSYCWFMVEFIGHCSLVGILYGNQSTPCTNNLRTTAGDVSVNRAYLGWNHIFQLQQGTVYPRLPSVLPWQMSQSLHHLGVLGPLGATLSLCKSEHSNPLSQRTEDKWEDKTERSSVWTWTKLHSLTLWTCKEIWRWIEWKWMPDTCFAAKNEYVLRNVMPSQWILFHMGTWMSCDIVRRYWQDGKARRERPMIWRSPLSCTKSPIAAFNLRRPWLIRCALPSTQSPNKNCHLGLRRMASQ